MSAKGRIEIKVNINEHGCDVLPVLYFERAILTFNVPGVKQLHMGPWFEV